MVKGTSSSTADDLWRDRERAYVGEIHAERLSLSLRSMAFPDSVKAHLNNVQSRTINADNLPNMSLRACIFGLLARDGVLLSSAKLDVNREGAANPKSVRQALEFRISTQSKHKPRSAWRRRNESLASRALFRSETHVRSIGTEALTRPGTEADPEMGSGMVLRVSCCVW